MNINWDKRTISKVTALSLACAISVTASIATTSAKLENSKNALAIDRQNAYIENQQQADKQPSIVPFVEDATTSNDSFENEDALQSVYNRILEESRKADTTKTAPSKKETTASTTTQTSASEMVTTTTTATVNIVNNNSSEKPEEQTVTNGKGEFNYSDVTSIAENLNTLEDFVEAVSPQSYCWDTTEYTATGNVTISLIAQSGIVTLDVKPLAALDEKNPTIDGQQAGSVNASSITEWEWYEANKASGCNISSVTWLSEEFGISVVRDIKLGSSMAEVTQNYLCINGGASVLYKASDVITNQQKLNELLANENVYTFVGGKVYGMSSYLEKYYSGKEHSYRFADCDYVIQYGCNSIMEYDYTTGSWIIEYAVKDDCTVGITFMNKSYREQADSTSTTSQEEKSRLQPSFRAGLKALD